MTQHHTKCSNVKMRRYSLVPISVPAMTIFLQYQQMKKWVKAVAQLLMLAPMHQMILLLSGAMGNVTHLASSERNMLPSLPIIMTATRLKKARVSAGRASTARLGTLPRSGAVVHAILSVLHTIILPVIEFEISKLHLYNCLHITNAASRS